MTVAVERSSSRSLLERTRRLGEHVRHVRMAVAAVAGGASVAFLAARDGSPLWQVLRVIGIAAITRLTLVVLARGRPRGVGRFVIVIAMPVIAVGVGFMPHLVKDGFSSVSAAAVVAVVAGLALLVGGIVLTGRGHGPIARVAVALATVLSAAVVAWVASPAVAATNVPHARVGASPAAEGLPYTSVTLETTDGVALAAWYVPARNGAAVVLLHGAGSTRSNVLDEAAVLAGHGFGVLLVDARGHGQSEGRAMDFGWHGDRDIAAATSFLTGRPEVDAGRIAVVGMSMGGEEAIGATASNSLIRAVVAEGATARTAGDEAWLSERFGWRGQIQEAFEAVQDVLTDALTSASVPIANREAVRKAATTRYFLIAAGDVETERLAASYVASGAPDRVETWTVPGAGHTDGLQTAPAEWERRVTAFLEDALGLSS